MYKREAKEGERANTEIRSVAEFCRVASLLQYSFCVGGGVEWGRGRERGGRPQCNLRFP
jgi:hypothetical protein